MSDGETHGSDSLFFPPLDLATLAGRDGGDDLDSSARALEFERGHVCREPHPWYGRGEAEGVSPTPGARPKLISMSDQSYSQNLAPLERAVSAGLGGFLLARYGRQSLFGALLGLGLVHRAATGHCAVYQALGVDTRDPSTPTLPERGSVHVTKSVLIRATPDQIYPYFTHKLETLVALSPEVLSLERLGEGCSRWTVDTPLGAHTFDSQIVFRVPDQSVDWECRDGKIPHSGEVLLEEGPRGTIVRVTIDYSPPGGALLAQLARLSGKEPHEALERALYNLQCLLEAGEVPLAQPTDDPTPEEVAL